MNKFNLLISFSVSLLLPFFALGAEPKQPEMYTYATYFSCDVVQEKAVDELVKSTYAPVYDAAVKDGTIAGWGWLAHHTGGEWRRILYHAAPSVDGLFAAQKKMGKKLDAVLGVNPDAMAKGCKTHVDNIWQFVAGSGSAAKSLPRGKAALSVYMECSFEGEENADEIFKTHFSPIYNAQIGKGKLTSWGWLSHVIGGKYRRLETLSAENYSDLLKARESILDSLYQDGKNKHAAEFSKICTSHVDYLWDIQLETP